MSLTVHPTNESLAFRVMVERLGTDPKTGRPLSKGRKFYSGAASRDDATALAEAQNRLERMKHNGAEYIYTVERG